MRTIKSYPNVVKISQSGAFAVYESGHEYPNAPDACMQVNIRGWPTRLNLMILDLTLMILLLLLSNAF